MTKMNINMRDMEEFIRNVRTEAYKKQLDICVGEIAERWRGSVVKRSPTGDTSMLKKSWHAELLVQPGPVHKAIVYNTATAGKTGAPYPIYVEYGHRIVRDGVTLGWVPGQFMLTKAKADVEKQMDKIVAKHMRIMWESVL